MNIAIPPKIKRKQSLTSSKGQELSPVLKRRLSYMQQLQQSRIEQKVDQKQEQQNTIQKQIQLNLSIIKGHNYRIVEIIAQLENLIENQVIMHEQCILSVVKKQINKMFMDCHQIMERLSIVLENKSCQNQTAELRNQMQFFRFEAEFYFVTNKKLKEENKKLNEKLKQKDHEMQELNLAIKNMTKKYLKEKAKNKYLQNEEKNRMDVKSTKCQQMYLIKSFTQEAVGAQEETLKQKRPKTMGYRRLKANKINTLKIQQPQQFQRNQQERNEFKYTPVTELGRKYQSQIGSKSYSTKFTHSKTNNKINGKVNSSTRANTLTLTNKNIDQQSWIYNREI